MFISGSKLLLMRYLRGLHGSFIALWGRYTPYGANIGAIEDRIVAEIYQYLTSFRSSKCAMMMTKKNFLHLAEEAVCKQKTSEFIETVAREKPVLDKYLESDVNFDASFRMSCIRPKFHR